MNARATPSPFAELARRASLDAWNARDARADCRAVWEGKKNRVCFFSRYDSSSRRRGERAPACKRDMDKGTIILIAIILP